MTRQRPNVFTIPPERPFLRQLAESWLAGDLNVGDPTDLALRLDTTIYLPTRRAARSFAETLAAAQGGVALLPRIRTLADAAEDEALEEPFSPAEPSDDPQRAETVSAGAPEAVPPSISPLWRRLILTRLIDAAGERIRQSMADAGVQGQPAFPQSATESAHLASALARLIDQVATEEREWSALADLVPEDYAAYWQLTLDLMALVTQNWPAILAETGAVDPATRRRLLLDARTRLLTEAARDEGLQGPIIVAGSTGSIPATARFLRAVATMPRGAVVLPGLDTQLPDPALAALDGDDADAASHPQQALHRLLAMMETSREEVRALGSVGQRQPFVSMALLPASHTDLWAAARPALVDADSAFANVDLLEAPTETAESLAIALCMRSALANGERVALITPDRTLARRVQFDLARFDLVADDSAGEPLRETAPGRFLIAVAQAWRSRFSAISLLTLLKHPLCALGQTPATTRRAARVLERLALRGTALPPGLEAIRAAIAARREAVTQGSAGHEPQLRRGTDETDDALALDLLARLESAYQPLAQLAENESAAAFSDYTDALFAVAERLATDAHTGSPNPLYAGPAGESAAALKLGLAEAADFGLTVGLSDAAHLFEALLAEPTVRPNPLPGDGPVIWGPLEARLQPADHLILGGLDEKAWPALPSANPFLSRAMMAGLDLDAPERRIGLSAHDIEQALGTPKVTLTRALKVDGAPTVASRWLQRLLAYLPPSTGEAMRARGAVVLGAAATLDRADAVRPCPRPEPRPKHPPTRLSVTDIEPLIRDPYAVYAKRVLGLEEAPGLGEPPGPAERGTLVHALLETIAPTLDGEPPEAWPPIYAAEVGRLLDAAVPFPALRALWGERLLAMAPGYLAWEAARQSALSARHAEVAARLELQVAGQTCILSGRADRLDQLRAGDAEIIDFKTGSPPSAKQLKQGLAPQLPLTAALLEAGAFEGVPALKAHAGRYIKLGTTVWSEPAKPFGRETLNPQGALEQLRTLWASFLAGAPFVPLARPMRQTDRARFHHLARVKEWSNTGGEDGEGADG
ncbi:MAG: double-strand break repair protein AddB [Devosiaceae bacterium]|nr:double-strand break repair protein AddB [Devosiaceae bacterium MH13]